MKPKPSHLLVLTLLAMLQNASADLSFAPVFNDGAVLQCEMPVTVWGKADPGGEVEIRLDGEAAATVNAEADGRWNASLPARQPGGPHVLTATSGAATREIKDVVFGEVWLASGQSNMAMGLSNSSGGMERLAMSLPGIRFMKVPAKTGLPVEREFTASDLAWKTFKPGSNGELSAVAFFFAEKLQPATGRTVGIVQCAVGGTPAQAWTPLWALDEKPELKHYADDLRAGMAATKSKEEWLEEAGALNQWRRDLAQWKKTGEGERPQNPGEPHPGNPWSQHTPTVLFENMVAPLIPYTARGVIWYQGEGNSGAPDEYRVLFPAMIHSWRKLWNRPDWPFLFVQLAAFDQPHRDWPGLRAAQTFTRDTVPHTGMALAIDCGEKGDIHPKAKQPVGERLALLALNQVHGRQTICRGPSFKAATVNGPMVTLKFDFTADGLEASDGKAEIPAFELAGADGLFHSAAARIAGKDSVEISAPAVAGPQSVRYAWAAWVAPPVTLRNSAGLPAEPFQAGLQ
jgi:sialate O-acetylesterase